MENNVYVMTGDRPITESNLKRLVVQHRSVGFSHINDKAIVNDHEVTEKFDTMNVGWAARGHYPRVEAYRDLYHDAIKGADSLINRRIINPIHSANIKTIDPGSYWVAHNSAISNESLVRSASLDAIHGKSPFKLPNTMISCLGGGGIVPSGAKSKYAVEYKPKLVLDDINDDWLTIANLRVGRALKSIRMSQALGASPISLDAVNTNISLEFLKSNSTVYKKHDSIIDFSFEYSVIDNEKLESILADASWSDVLHIRKQTLPILCQTKKIIAHKMRNIDLYDTKSPEELFNFLNSLQKEFLDLKEKESEAWESLRIGSVLKSGGAFGTWSLGTSVIPVTMSVTQSVLTLLATGLVAGSTMADELKALIPAKRKVKEHPLFILDNCKSLPLSGIA